MFRKVRAGAIPTRNSNGLMLNPVSKGISFLYSANTDGRSGRITKLYCNRYSFEFAD